MGIIIQIMVFLSVFQPKRGGDFRGRSGRNPFARYAEQLARDGKMDEAIDVLRKGIEANGIYAPGHSVLARLLFQQGADEEAAVELAKALELDPQMPKDLLKMGRYHIKRKEPLKALDLLWASLRFEPEAPVAQNALREAELARETLDDINLSEQSEKVLSELSIPEGAETMVAGIDESDEGETMIAGPGEPEETVEEVPGPEIPEDDGTETIIGGSDAEVAKESPEEMIDGAAEIPGAEPEAEAFGAEASADTIIAEPEEIVAEDLEPEEAEDDSAAAYETEEEGCLTDEDLVDTAKREEPVEAPDEETPGEIDEDAFGAMIDESLEEEGSAGEKIDEETGEERFDEETAGESDGEIIGETAEEPASIHTDMAFEEEITDDIPSRPSVRRDDVPDEVDDDTFDALIDEGIESGELTVDGEPIEETDESPEPEEEQFDDADLPGEVDDDTFDALIDEGAEEGDDLGVEAGESTKTIAPFTAAYESMEKMADSGSAGEPADAVDFDEPTAQAVDAVDDGLSEDMEDEEGAGAGSSLLDELGIGGDLDEATVDSPETAAVDTDEENFPDALDEDAIDFETSVSETVSEEEREEAAEPAEIVSAGIGDAIKEVEVHEIDDVESYDPDKFGFEYGGDDEPVLGDEERAELLSLHDAGDGDDAAVGAGEKDELDDGLMGKLSVEELDILSGAPEDRIGADTELEEETREGIDYSDVLSAYGADESIEEAIEPETAAGMETGGHEDVDTSMPGEAEELTEPTVGPDTEDAAAAPGMPDKPGEASEDESLKYVEDLIREAPVIEMPGEEDVSDAGIPGEEEAAGPETEKEAAAAVEEVPIEVLIADYEKSIMGGDAGDSDVSEPAVSDSDPAEPVDTNVASDTGGDIWMVEEGAGNGDEMENMTATMAEIYVSQGLIGPALDIYKMIVKREPDNRTILARIKELQDMLGEETGN